MVRRSRTLLLTLIVASPAGASASDASLQQELKEILRDPALEDAEVGLQVRTIDGRVIFDKNGDRLFNPASNVKIVTSAAALYYLGPYYRFRTVVYRDRSLRGGTLNGNLYIKGRGDPTLTNEELFGLINEVALRGIERINGDVIVDDTFFDEVYEGPGWEQERGDRSYAPPVGALSVNYGTFSIRVAPGDRAGGAAKVFVYPPLDSVKVVSSVRTRGSGARPRVWVGTSRTDDHNGIEVSVRGAISLGDPYGAAFYRRVYHPSLYAGETIKELLEMRGIKIKGRVKLGQVPRRGVVGIATHFSQPLASVVNTLNKFSNNFIAEMVLKTLGAERYGEPGTWEKGCLAAADFMEEIGIEKRTYVLGNGSGLNDINRLTPGQLNQILIEMHKRTEIAPEFVASLALAGAFGTITSRFLDSPAENRLRAKTGSLTGVSALSGYVTTRDNQLLTFSVMMNGYNGRARDMWEVQNNIGNALAEFSHRELISDSSLAQTD